VILYQVPYLAIRWLSSAASGHEHPQDCAVQEAVVKCATTVVEHCTVLCSSRVGLCCISSTADRAWAAVYTCGPRLQRQLPPMGVLADLHAPPLPGGKSARVAAVTETGVLTPAGLNRYSCSESVTYTANEWLDSNTAACATQMFESRTSNLGSPKTDSTTSPHTSDRTSTASTQQTTMHMLHASTTKQPSKTGSSISSCFLGATSRKQSQKLWIV
jgi:hypothetical protein